MAVVTNTVIKGNARKYSTAKKELTAEEKFIEAKNCILQVISYAKKMQAQNICVSNYYNICSNEINLNSVECRESISVFKELANKDNLEAMYYLGCAYGLGIGMAKKDLNLALNYFLEAAESGFEKAYYAVGLCYYNGAIGSEDNSEVYDEKAFEYLLKAADLNQSDAQLIVGHFYYIGKVINEDFDEVEKWYTCALKNGNKNAYSLFGELFSSKKDYKQAIAYYEKAIKESETDDNFEVDYFKIADCYLKLGDSDNAIATLGKAKVKNPSKAYTLLGDIYYDGVYVKKDYLEALKHYKLSIETGDFIHCFAALEKLVILYSKDFIGKNREADGEWYKEWFSRAAKYNFIIAQFFLANRNFYGDIFPQNYDEARLNYESVIKQYEINQTTQYYEIDQAKNISIANCKTALNNLATIYFNGLGINKDKKLAKKYKKSAKQIKL